MHGRPVICSNIGGMAEKVTDGINGLHFRVGDPTSLAGAIRKGVQSPATWEKMRQGIPPVYRLDDQIATLCRLYRELLANRVSVSGVHATVD
jgi:glycosyltransferase involved in cell wall biosynthesis